jgi:PEGA domain
VVRGNLQPGKGAEFETATPTSVGERFDNEATKPQASNAGVSRERVIHLGTRCATEAEFVERFAAFTTNKVLTMPGRVDLPADATARFVIALASRQPVLEGRCRVLAPPGGTPDNKVRLEFVEMSARSLAVHAKLLRAGSAPKPKTAPAPPPLPRRAPPPLTARATAASKVPQLAPHPPFATGTATAPSERVPGAEYQLPANPFGKVESEALESFVECTIFEEDGSPPPRTEITEDGPTAVGRIRVPEGGEAAFIDDWAEGQQTPVARIPKNLAQQAAAIIDELAAKDPERTTAKFGSDLMASAYADGMITSVPRANAETQPAFGAAMPAVAMPSDPTELIATQQPAFIGQQAKRLPIFGFVAGLLLGAVLGFVLRGGSTESVNRITAQTEATAPPAPAATVASDPAATPPPPQAAPEVVSAAELAAEAKDLKVSPPPSPGPCLVDITTNPPGAVVRWNNKILGTSPLVGKSVPCGAAKVGLHKAKFRMVTLDANVVPEMPFRIEHDLRAPLVRLQITSVPPGSILQLNRRKMGTTPRTLFVPMKVATMVRVMRPGHEPWLRRVVPTGANTKVHAALVPLAKASGKSTVKPTAQTPVAASKAAVAPAKSAAVAPKTPFAAPKPVQNKR